MQSVSWRQTAPIAQRGQALPPQSTSLSSPPTVWFAQETPPPSIDATSSSPASGFGSRSTSEPSALVWEPPIDASPGSPPAPVDPAAPPPAPLGPIAGISSTNVRFGAPHAN